MIQDTQTVVIPPAPKTVRGYPSSLDATETHLLYFNGTSVILKNLIKPDQTLSLTHASDVSAAKFSHDGRLIASIDVKGTLVIS